LFQNSLKNYLKLTLPFTTKLKQENELDMTNVNVFICENCKHLPCNNLNSNVTIIKKSGKVNIYCQRHSSLQELCI